ncbi:hypothetical protein RRG08_014640 [Elysia crispata]|uniref:Uncharacterized protein n=1 Tax=Elysia crispata TaxID=231223 RepID=A0AAE0YI52_9GAST|nr:hypothetical protein RRG08_014640 [Elysia crispata]
MPGAVVRPVCPVRGGQEASLNPVASDKLRASRAWSIQQVDVKSLVLTQSLEVILELSLESLEHPAVSEGHPRAKPGELGASNRCPVGKWTYPQRPGISTRDQMLPGIGQ